jgi:hypothetical protein
MQFLISKTNNTPERPSMETKYLGDGSLSTQLASLNDNVKVNRE